jgi:hypothetical protein
MPSNQVLPLRYRPTTFIPVYTVHHPKVRPRPPTSDLFTISNPTNTLGLAADQFGAVEFPVFHYRVNSNSVIVVALLIEYILDGPVSSFWLDVVRSTLRKYLGTALPRLCTFCRSLMKMSVLRVLSPGVALFSELPGDLSLRGIWSCLSPVWHRVENVIDRASFVCISVWDGG